MVFMKRHRCIAVPRVELLTSGLTRLLIGLLAALLSLPASAGDAGASDRGFFQITKTLNQVMGEQAAANAAGVINGDTPISWEVFVPESYDAGKPPGLMVYISPSYSGEMPQVWRRVLEEKNLIWVGANNAGNSVNVQLRALFALIAPTMIRQEYVVDADRFYISGLSGGGKMASMVATEYAHLFKGAIYNCGVEFWDKHPPRRFELIKQNRFVFVTGEHDQALRPTKRIFKRYEKAGVPHIKLMVIRDMGHENPDAGNFSEALDFLDGLDS